MTTKSVITHVLTWIFVVSVLSGCSADALQIEDVAEQAETIRLGVSVGKMEAVEPTRGIPIDSDEDLTSLGLFGVKYASSQTFAAVSSTVKPADYIWNKQVVGEDWNTEYSWPGHGMTASFFAYAPYGASGLTPSTATYPGAPYLSYKLPKLATDQADIMVAEAIDEQETTDKRRIVPMHFDHIMSKVVVGSGEDGMPYGAIDSIRLVDVYDEGVYDMSSHAWRNIDGLAAVKATDMNSTGMANQSFTSGQATFMMIPQTLQNTTELDVKYKSGKRYRTKLKDLTPTWEQGHQYVYALNAFLWDFEYTGEVQIFPVTKTGYYKIECWGASGGSAYCADATTPTANDPTGGSGAYVCGTIYFAPVLPINLYIYVGEEGGFQNGSTALTFNGGGGGAFTECYHLRGGGATDVRLTSNGNWKANLSSRIIVAAGGGGATQYGSVRPENGNGGAAGGLNGYRGTTTYHISWISGYNNRTEATGGTQNGGGNGWKSSGNLQHSQNGGLGYGGTASIYGAGGGSGYYGGGSGGYVNGVVSTGAGGSSYISGHAGCATYTGYVFTDITMIDGKGYLWPSNTNTVGAYVGMTSPSGTNEVGHDGNGYCRITYLGPTL